LRKCAICGYRTTDGSPWTSDTLHPEYKGQYLCKACSLGLNPNRSVSSDDKTSTKSSGSRIYIGMGILLVISAIFVLYPSGTALIEAANALPAGSWDYYPELTQLFYKAMLQFFGFVTLYVVIGLGISHLHDKENSR